MTCACTGIDLISPVVIAVDAAMTRNSTPTTIEAAVAASSSKSNRNGAAMKRMPMAYSRTPCTKAGTGPFLNMGPSYPLGPRPSAAPRRRSAEEDLGSLEQPAVEQLGLGERLRERHALDLRAAQRDHLPEVALVGRVDRLDPEAGAEHAVVGDRRAAALDVAEDRHPRLEAGPLLDLALELDRDPAEADVAERVGRLELRLQAAVLRRRALGDHDDREVAPARVAAAQPLADLLDVERVLGDEHDVGAAGQARVGGDPARVPTHDLDHDHTVVRLRRRVQAVDRLRRDLHPRLEAEGEVGAREVVVDRLGDTDDVHPLLRQLARHAERVLAADRDQR